MFFCNLCDGRVVVVLYKIVCYGSPAINLKNQDLNHHMPGLVHVNRTMVAIFANIKCERLAE